MADGETPAEALKNVETIIAEWLETQAFQTAKILPDKEKTNNTADMLRQMSDEVKNEIYHQLQSEHVKTDVISRLAESNMQLSEQDVAKVTHAYVYECRYDCNRSYWENLDALIMEVLLEKVGKELNESKGDHDLTGVEITDVDIANALSLALDYLEAQTFSDFDAAISVSAQTTLSNICKVLSEQEADNEYNLSC